MQVAETEKGSGLLKDSEPPAGTVIVLDRREACAVKSKVTNVAIMIVFIE